MKNFFLDTNIVIDVLIDRKPFSDDGKIIFENGINKKIKLYISALSYATIYYYIKKSTSSHEKTMLILNKLNSFIETTDVNNTTIKNALNSNFKDFEDAIQYHSAKNKSIDAIITRNPKDFKNSSLLILTPDEALAIL